MSKIELSTKSLIGIILMLTGLGIIAYVSFNAFYLANGAIKPLQIQINDATGRTLIPSVESQVLLGILTQGIMYGVLVGAASVLLKNGLLILKQSL